jgi:hypothetical protein
VQYLYVHLLTCLVLLLFLAGTLLLLLQAAPAQSSPLGRSLLQNGGKTIKNRQDNDLRAAVATRDSIMMAVRKGAGAGVRGATSDGMSLSRKASSASAAPSDFAPGGDERRRLLQLQQHLAISTHNTLVGSASAAEGSFVSRIARKLLQGSGIGTNAALSTWSVMSAAEDIEVAAFGGAQLKAVLETTTQGNKLSRLVSSRNLDPSAFDKKRSSA